MQVVEPTGICPFSGVVLPTDVDAIMILAGWATGGDREVVERLLEMREHANQVEQYDAIIAALAQHERVA